VIGAGKPAGHPCQKCKGPRHYLVRWDQDGLWVGPCCRRQPKRSLRELEAEARRRQLGLFGKRGGR
jgi:hypothetical protein